MTIATLGINVYDDKTSEVVTRFHDGTTVDVCAA